MTLEGPNGGLRTPGLLFKSRLLASLLAFLSAGAALALASREAQAYTEAELTKSRVYVATKMRGDQRYKLDKMAEKAGKPPEVVFLDLLAISPGATLGEDSRDPSTPAAKPSNARSKHGKWRKERINLKGKVVGVPKRRKAKSTAN